MSEFNKNVGTRIDKTKENKLRANWKRTNIKTQSVFIGADAVNGLLSQAGAVGLRIYLGLDDDGNLQPIFFASDSEGNPIKQRVQEKDLTDDGGIDASLPCPPYCPKGDE
jgi:hypothetical protein